MAKLERWDQHGDMFWYSVRDKMHRYQNCYQQVCFKNADLTYSIGCRICDKGYYGIGTMTNAGAPTCTKIEYETGITYPTGEVRQNCEWYWNDLNPGKCYTCKSSYAADSSGATCVAYTRDPNCRRLNTASNCSHCFDAYYWDLKLCKLKALTVLFNIALSVGVWVFVW